MTPVDCTYIIGIDPGRDGGVVALDRATGEPLAAHTMSEVSLDPDVLYTYWQGSIACIEDIHALGNVGAKTTFQFGRYLGRIEGILLAKRVRTCCIPPKDWQEILPLETIKDIPKEKRRDALKRLSLQAWLDNPHNSGVGNGKHDGIADAYNIARFGLQLLNENRLTTL